MLYIKSVAAKMAGAWFIHRLVRPVHGLYRPLLNAQKGTNHSTTVNVLRNFFWDHPGEPVPEENFWTLWCKGRLIEADTSTIRLGVTPSGLTSAHLHHTPIFTGWMPFLLPNQQYQNTEGNQCIRIREKTLEFSSMVLNKAHTNYMHSTFVLSCTRRTWKK